MTGSKLIGHKVSIPSFDGRHHGDWGIVLDYDGEVYYVAFCGDQSSVLIFDRKELRLMKGE